MALNPKAHPDELSDLLNVVRCSVLMYHGEVAASAAELKAGVPSLRRTVAFGGSASGTFDRWLDQPGDHATPRVPTGPDHVAMIMGTGGTTGRPKAVPITNAQYLAMGLAFNSHMWEAAPPTYLLATPMTHAAGLSAWPVFAEGGTVVVHDGVDAHAIFRSIERHQVSRLFLPPTAIYKLLSTPEVHDVDFSSLRHFIYAAAPMSADKLAEAMDVFGPVMAQTFGQAEAPMICTCLTPADHEAALQSLDARRRLSSCGRSSLVASLAIMSEDGDLLGPEQQGEIVVRGALVMDGYLDDVVATAEASRAGGWHGTGDLGFRDDDGFVYIVDRKRDMIITGGFNVYPSAVERVLWAHPDVLDCAVIGLPDDKWGEAVTAIVELKPDARPDADTLIALCKAQLGSVQAPKTVIFRELPRSPAGKVLKRFLRDEFWEGKARRV